MTKIEIGKMLIKKLFFLNFLLFSMYNQETNIFQNKIKYSNFKVTDFTNNNYISQKRKLENKENSITVIAKGKKNEKINILYDFFKYLPSKVFLNDVKENLGQINKVNLTKDGENKIVMIWDYSIQDCVFMFLNCKSLISIDMSKFDSSLITSMEKMFFGCTNVSFINLTNFITSSVNNMNSVFQDCYKIKNLDISNFDTSSVTIMNSMFENCYTLISLDVSKFNTTSTQIFNGMFYNCYSLTSIDLSNFDTSSLIDMRFMFAKCKEIKYLNLSTFFTEKIERMNNLFEGCINLESFDFPNLDTTNIKYLDEIFSNCTNLKYINIENYKGKDIFYSIPYKNNLTICLKDDIIPKSLKQMKVKNTCSNYDTINTTIFPKTNIPTLEQTEEVSANIEIYNEHTSSSSVKLIIGIIIGIIVFIIAIIITLILVLKKQKKEIVDNTCYVDDVNIMKENKKLSDKLLKEFELKLYNNNIIKNCPKCIICNKDFINNLSRIITINCGHSFHKPCFKNHIYKNINCPNCPICSRNLLGTNDEMKTNISNPSISENNRDQINLTNLTENKNLNL